MRNIALVALVLSLAECREDPPAHAARCEVKRVGDNTLQLVPVAGQLPYCLVFTISERGLIRQLTMTRENKSMHCEAGQPIGGLTFKVPADEGPVKVHVFFSDQKINAASVAQQVLEIRDNPKWSQLDLRLPGKVNMEVLDFTPSNENAAPSVGGLIGDAGELQPDGGE